jgi:DNA-directed RNA polymerase subunit F
MEVINARSALLSNYEVLSLLRELSDEHVARTKSAFRVKKEEEASGISHPLTASREPEVLQNLRTVEVEAISYLAADYQPTASQTPEGITKLVKDLAPYGLTKAEKLQIVNLAPTEPVELYVIVEELEDRMSDNMEDILNLVSSSLQPSEAVASGNNSDLQIVGSVDTSAAVVCPANDNEPAEYYEPDNWDGANEFDDTGEGAGIEGDLDMEED